MLLLLLLDPLPFVFSPFHCLPLFPLPLPRPYPLPLLLPVQVCLVLCWWALVRSWKVRDC